MSQAGPSASSNAPLTVLQFGFSLALMSDCHALYCLIPWRVCITPLYCLNLYSSDPDIRNVMKEYTQNLVS